MDYKFRECMDIVGNPAQVTSPHSLFWLRMFFGRARSRWFGSLADAHLPTALRAPLIQAFAWKYGANLDEVRYPLDAYHTFNEFFTRALKDDARPIAEVDRGLVSPVDAQVLSIGEIDREDARIEQVKGATYSVPAFLGTEPMAIAGPSSVVRYVVLYLAPGDYHRIHAPCKVTFTKGRHFAGEVLPMSPSFLRRFDDLFAVNERVVLSGEWELGQFHLVAVGAAMVGSIYLDFDAKLKTNRLRDITVHCGGDVSSKLYPGGVDLGPGDGLGGFKMGSTVVLFFDAPKDFLWEVEPGERVQVGKPLGRVAV